MIKIDFSPMSGVFLLSGKYIVSDKEYYYSVRMHWDSDTLNDPTIDKITWVDSPPDDEKTEAESKIHEEIKSTNRTFSIIYQ